MPNTIAVENLRVGMFIHLDLGWLHHPFPLSSFRIGSADEIARIRGLGVKRLRWSPERSDLHEREEPRPSVAAIAAEAIAAASGEGQRRAALAAQRAEMRRCEEQYGEASGVLKGALSKAAQRPAEARSEAERLTRALLDKMLTHAELAILVLSGNAGEKATAHPLNVGVIALLMGRVFGLSEADLADLGVGALLHDVGKLELPQRVHHHDERLTAAEVNVYRDHVNLGVALGRRMGLSDGALQVLAQHHENADGTGFPQRLTIDRISTAARIVAIVDRYDRLCNPSSLARSLTPHEALARLFALVRDKVDATMLNAFIRMMGVYPAGSVVQLTDDRYALVVSANAARPLKPRVLVHDGAVPRDEALLVNLSQVPDLGIRRSLPIAQLPEAAREYLQPTPRVAYFFHSAAPACTPAAGCA
jgi:putative nucleotidyltransferase with HDIG domain